MGVLSKHKHMDTTKNHYIEMELEKMLEATYGVSIGSELINAETKFVDAIPAHLDGADSDVENGCGKCSAEHCVSIIGYTTTAYVALRGAYSAKAAIDNVKKI